MCVCVDLCAIVHDGRCVSRNFSISPENADFTHLFTHFTHFLHNPRWHHQQFSIYLNENGLYAQWLNFMDGIVFCFHINANETWKIWFLINLTKNEHENDKSFQIGYGKQSLFIIFLLKCRVLTQHQLELSWKCSQTNRFFLSRQAEIRISLYLFEIYLIEFVLNARIRPNRWIGTTLNWICTFLYVCLC